MDHQMDQPNGPIGKLSNIQVVVELLAMELFDIFDYFIEPVIKNRVDELIKSY